MMDLHPTVVDHVSHMSRCIRSITTMRYIKLTSLHTSKLAQCMSDRGITWFPAWCLTSRSSSPIFSCKTELCQSDAGPPLCCHQRSQSCIPDRQMHRPLQHVYLPPGMYKTSYVSEYRIWHLNRPLLSQTGRAMLRISLQSASAVRYLKRCLLVLVTSASNLLLHTIKFCSVLFGVFIHSAGYNKQRFTDALSSVR